MLSKELITKLEYYLNEHLKFDEIDEINNYKNIEMYEVCYMDYYEDLSYDELEDFIKDNKEITFRDFLFKLIDDRNIKDSDVYKKAGIDRKLFSKIRSKNDYHPSKKTSIALGLALELDVEDMNKLLNTSGYSLSKNDKFDLIISFFINNNIFDLFNINEVLERYSLKPFTLN